MLPKAARLRNTRDFQEVFKKRGGVQDSRLFLKAHITRDKKVRIGIVVSKQVAPKAVERNRIKRLLREAIQAVLPAMKTGYDVVLIALPGLQLMGFQDAKQRVLGIIRKASLLNQ